MRQRVFVILAVLSLLISVALSWLWELSHSWREAVEFRSVSAGWRAEVGTEPGGIRLVHGSYHRSDQMPKLRALERSSHWAIADDPFVWSELEVTRMLGFRIGRHHSIASAAPYKFFVRSQGTFCVVPFWALTTASAAAAIAFGWRARKWGTRPTTDLCPSCGYDLRATPERCPECGRATATSSASTT